MKIQKVLLTGVCALTLGGTALAQAPAPMQGTPQAQAGKASLDQIQGWSADSKKAARAMLDKYGPPNETTASMWVWHNNGPWKRTIVYSEAVDHRFPMPHKDVLEQVIDYKVPTDKYDELAKYDGSVIVERTKGEISARCDKEGLNFLAVNLANDVATGKRDVDDARKFYGKTAMDFKQGKQPQYTRGLAFNVQKGGTADPDKPLEGMPADQGMGGSGEPMKEE
ncbi:hypothetical protein ACLESO_55205 [Pyxidicoccus sp. 3LG]